MNPDSTLSLLLQLLRGELPPGPLDESTWLSLIQVAGRQTVVGGLYQAAERFPEDFPVSERVLFTLLTEVNKIVNRNLKLGEVEREVLGILRSGGLEPVVMKGSICAARYPSPELRTGGDIDLYIREADFPRAMELLKTSGIACSHKPDGSMDATLRGCEVELHRRYFDLHVREALLPPVGTPESELVMLSAHIRKHACGVGVGLRQIIDFTLAYKAYPGDYKELHELFRRCGLKRWDALLLSFIKDYIDPSAEIPKSVDSSELFRIVEKGGNFGHFHSKRLETLYDKSPLKRKFHTARLFFGRLPFSFRYAPREILPLLSQLFCGNL